jgi:chlorophyll synthase
MERSLSRTSTPLPSPGATLELLKPITWFPPMWAFGCGVVSSGAPVAGRGATIIAGIMLAGPLVCAMSQAVNDWFDRHVDAINQPERPIPSGRIPGQWGLYIAIFWTALSLALAWQLGPVVTWAAVVGIALAWAYSAPPFRLKRNGWIGNGAVGLCYEGLAWITGAAVMSAPAMPEPRVFVLAALYSLGAHGIMTLNDFKSIEGDRRTGIGSLPARLGPRTAAWVACGFMIAPQLAVIGLLASWGHLAGASAITVLVLTQIACMLRLLDDPRGRAPWYNATGVSLYVLGMLVSAFALRALSGAGA